MDRLVSLFRLIDSVPRHNAPIEVMKILSIYEKDVLHVETVSQQEGNTSYYLVKATLNGNNFSARDRNLQFAKVEVARLVYNFLKSIVKLQIANEKHTDSSLEKLLEKWLSLSLPRSNVDELAQQVFLQTPNSTFDINANCGDSKEYSQFKDWKSLQSNDWKLSSLITNLKERGINVILDYYSSIDSTTFDSIYYAKIDIPDLDKSFEGSSDVSNIDALKVASQKLKIFFDQMALENNDTQKNDFIDRVDEMASQEFNSLSENKPKSVNSKTEKLDSKSIQQEQSSPSTADICAQINLENVKLFHILKVTDYDKLTNVFNHFNLVLGKPFDEAMQYLAQVEPFTIKSSINTYNGQDQYTTLISYFSLCFTSVSNNKSDSTNRAMKLLYERLKTLMDLFVLFKKFYSPSKNPIDILDELINFHWNLVKLQVNNHEIQIGFVHFVNISGSMDSNESRINVYTAAVNYLKQFSDRITTSETTMPVAIAEKICKSTVEPKKEYTQSRIFEPKIMNQIHSHISQPPIDKPVATHPGNSYTSNQQIDKSVATHSGNSYTSTQQIEKPSLRQAHSYSPRTPYPPINKPTVPQINSYIPNQSIIPSNAPNSYNRSKPNGYHFNTNSYKKPNYNRSNKYNSYNKKPFDVNNNSNKKASVDINPIKKKPTKRSDPSKLHKQDFNRVKVLNLFNSAYSPDKSPSNVIKDLGKMSQDILKFSSKFDNFKRMHQTSLAIENFTPFVGKADNEEHSQENALNDAFDCFLGISLLIYSFNQEFLAGNSPSEIMDVLLVKHKDMIRLVSEPNCVTITFQNMSANVINVQNRRNQVDSRQEAYKLAVELLDKWSQLVRLHAQIIAK